MSIIGGAAALAVVVFMTWLTIRGLRASRRPKAKLGSWPGNIPTPPSLGPEV